MLKVYNTLGRELQEFQPICKESDKKKDNDSTKDIGKTQIKAEPTETNKKVSNPLQGDKKTIVTFYHCGPTVYNVQHIGNLRAVTASDFIRRILKYIGYDVKFVRNYTDFGHLVSEADEGEDKMMKGAKREGLKPQEIAEKYIDIYDRHVVEMNAIPPTYNPRATAHINEMIELIHFLLKHGYAYNTNEVIYYDTSKFPKYTELSGADLNKEIEGAGHGENQDKNKKNPSDFALWFFKTGTHANSLLTWDSPFDSASVENGRGTPGWHTECSAMAKYYLGNTIDFHMGGIEHIPIHHTNEIAQSEAYTGKKYVNYWLHNEHLTIDGRKMSKSLGNVYNLDELVNKGYSPMDLRFFFAQAHYRSKQNFTFQALKSARQSRQNIIKKLVKIVHQDNITLKKLFSIKENVQIINHHNSIEEKQKTKVSRDKNNINTDQKKNATILDQIKLRRSGEVYQDFIESISDDFNVPKALGIMCSMLDVQITEISGTEKLILAISFDEVFGIKLYESIVNELKNDSSSSNQGRIKIDNLPNDVQEILEQRHKAREEKDWAKSDELRDQLQAQYGLEVKDTSTGTEVYRIMGS